MSTLPQRIQFRTESTGEALCANRACLHMALLDVSRYCPVHDDDGLYVASVRRKHALAIDRTRRQDATVAYNAAQRGIA